MNQVLICVDGVWSVVSGQVACSGTAIESHTVDSIFTAQHFITQETFEAFWPWALLMFATAFGVRMIRRVILTKG